MNLLENKPPRSKGRGFLPQSDVANPPRLTRLIRLTGFDGLQAEKSDSHFHPRLKRRGILARNKLLVLIFLAGLVTRLFMSVQIYSGDVNNHISWGRDVLIQGTSGIYDRDFYPLYGTLTPTYPPIPLYLFSISQFLYEKSYDLAWWLNLRLAIFPSNVIFFLEDQDTLPAFHKIWAILADVGLAYVLVRFASLLFPKKMSFVRSKVIIASLVLFNPAFFYNSAVWGQIESIPLLFAIWAFYLLIRDRRSLVLSSLMMSCALLTKQTSIIFVPVYIAVVVSRYQIKDLVRPVLLNILLWFLFFLPFHSSGNLLSFPFETYLNKIQTGSGSNNVTDHAFNFWMLVEGLDPLPDWWKFLFGISYKAWSYVIYAAMVFVVLVGLVKRGMQKINIVQACVLVAFASFLFLTRMHERYLAQAFPFLLLLVVKEKKFFVIFVFLSLFHFINLYHNWWVPRIDWLVDILQSQFVLNSLSLFAITSYFYLLVQYVRSVRRV